MEKVRRPTMYTCCIHERSFGDGKRKEEGMISRRDFLKLFPALLAGGYAASVQTIAVKAQKEAFSLYQGANLQGWTVALGDAIYARPGEPQVSLSDIKTIHYTGYSELQANTLRRVIMAHNITHKKIVDSTAMNYIHTCTASFRLPYLPVADENSLLNAQSLEGGIFVWDGNSVGAESMV
jgi:hypothetical protein